MMGKTLEELIEMNKDFEISEEAAGAGFAASIALASKYSGQETSSIQVLREIGVVLEGEKPEKQIPHKPTSEVSVVSGRELKDLYEQVVETYSEQSEGWKKRNLFERQWVARDFKKSTGMSIDEMVAALRNIGHTFDDRAASKNSAELLGKLAAYYEHQAEQLKGYENTTKKLEQNLAIIDHWVKDTRLLIQRLKDRMATQGLQS